MVILTFIAVLAFVIMLAGMSWVHGTQRSISALAGECRWLLCATIWSQLLLLPVMLEVTPEPWKWLVAVGMFLIALTGASNVLDKADSLVHTIAAVAGFTLLAGWTMVVDSKCLIALFVCAAAGGLEHWKWRVETGLIISVYMTIVHQIL